ncbi:MAG: DNA alkylation repair protein [Sideroxydans sp.]
MSARTIQAELRALADPATAAVLQRFFKTGAGEYGAGDAFLGIKVPVLRALAQRQPNVTLRSISALLHSRYHEERLYALLLLIRHYQQADAAGRCTAFDLYLAHTARINNWDLVDISAPHIVGRHLQDRSRKVLHKMAQSASLWERRIAIVATFHFIRCGDFSDTLRIAATLLGDEQDLIHKAVGWMLREVGKRNQNTLETFLQQHYPHLPRTTLRYAIERFAPALRQQYLQGTFPVA